MFRECFARRALVLLTMYYLRSPLNNKTIKAYKVSEEAIREYYRSLILPNAPDQKYYRGNAECNDFVVSPFVCPFLENAVFAF